MKKLAYYLIILLIFSFPPFLQVAQSSEIDSDFQCQKRIGPKQRAKIIKKIDSKYKEIGSFTAKFLQESKMLAGTETISNTGEVKFSKPGLMLWDYISPEEQKFVADGETVWYYRPEEEGAGEVSLFDFENAFSSETPASFLLGLGKLSSDFSSDSGCKTKKGYILELSPKVEDENLEKFYLLVRKSDYLAVAAKIVDFSENETLIKFLEIELNPELPKEQFTFKIPKGAYIDDQRTLGRKS